MQWSLERRTEHGVHWELSSACAPLARASSSACGTRSDQQAQWRPVHGTRGDLCTAACGSAALYLLELPLALPQLAVLLEGRLGKLLAQPARARHERVAHPPRLALALRHLELQAAHLGRQLAHLLRHVREGGRRWEEVEEGGRR